MKETKITIDYGKDGKGGSKVEIVQEKENSSLLFVYVNNKFKTLICGTDLIWNEMVFISKDDIISLKDDEIVKLIKSKVFTEEEMGKSLGNLKVKNGVS